MRFYPTPGAGMPSLAPFYWGTGAPSRVKIREIAKGCYSGWGRRHEI